MCAEFSIKLVETLTNEYNDKMNFSKNVDADIDDMDAHSHHLESDEEAALIDDRLQSLVYLQAISNAPATEIALGSLIETSKFFMYVGISTDKFTDEGADIIGISIDAPIYKELKGKKVGDTFKFGSNQSEILSIQ